MISIILPYIISIEQFGKSNNYMSKKIILLDATSMVGHMISFYLRSEKQYEWMVSHNNLYQGVYK